LVYGLNSHLPDYSIPLTFFLLKGRGCRDTVALVPSDNFIEPVKIQMNKCIQQNRYFFLGDIASIFSCSDCPTCTRVAILPFKDTVELLSGHLFDTFLKPFFASTYRLIQKLDTFTISA
jgi:transitional endoplasmic reticulum ATPase